MLRVRTDALALALALAAAACSASPVDGPASTPDGGALDAADAGADSGCAPGTLPRDDGSCRPAGIAADECGDGFAHDGEDACDPILPEVPCGKGTMAIPGETACREVAPCGLGTWGDIPVEADTQYVDGSYTGGDSDGSAAKPWTTVQSGVDAAAPGAIVAIAAGSYVEHVLVQGSPVRLWGKCPAEVELVGPVGSMFVVDVRSADGTEVHDLAATGGGVGIAFAGSEDALAERVWIHDTTDPGWMLQDYGGKTSAALRASLVESARGVGAYAVGASMTIEGSVLRATRSGPDKHFGRGIDVIDDPTSGRRSELTMRRSVVEQSRESGVSIYGSTALVEDSVVRDTQPSDADSSDGSGISVWFQLDTKERASLTLRRSVISHVYRGGISVQDSDLDVEATVVRDTKPDQSDQTGGIGILCVDATEVAAGQSRIGIRRSVVERAHLAGIGTAGVSAAVESVAVRDIEARISDALGGRGMTLENNGLVAPPVPGRGEVRGCRVERTQEAGIMFVGITGILEGTLVQDVEPRPDGLFGRGVSVEVDPPSGFASSVAFDRVRVERTHEFGVFVVGSQATVVDTVIRDTRMRPADQAYGVGLGIQMSFENGTAAQASLRTTTIEESHEIGIWVAGAVVDLEDVTVRDTKAIGDGSYGDGILVSTAFWNYATVATSVHATRSRVEGSARAGVSNFAADVSMGDSALSCNVIHIDGESFEGKTFVFTDRGGNTCGCDGEPVECAVLSASLSAPEPLEQ